MSTIITVAVVVVVSAALIVAVFAISAGILSGLISQQEERFEGPDRTIPAQVVEMPGEAPPVVAYPLPERYDSHGRPREIPAAEVAKGSA
jgi:hypothetical protein